MRNVPVTLLSAADDVTRTGSAYFVGQVVAASFIPVFGDVAAAGTVKLQGSNEAPVGDPNSYVPSSASWKDIPSASSTITAGVGPAVTLANLNFQYIRAVFTQSAAGSTTVVVSASLCSV